MTNIQVNLQYSFYEISEILRFMPIEYRKKLPEKFIKFIDENKMNNNFVYNKNITLDKQEILEDTKVLLSILYRTYWCSEDKRRELEEEDNNFIREKFNPDNIFNNSNKVKNIEEFSDEDKVSLVEYKESIFRKIINRIKDIFK